jgi:hypothetical protein
MRATLDEQEQVQSVAVVKTLAGIPRLDGLDSGI